MMKRVAFFKDLKGSKTGWPDSETTSPSLSGGWKPMTLISSRSHSGRSDRWDQRTAYSWVSFLGPMRCPRRTLSARLSTISQRCAYVGRLRDAPKGYESKTHRDWSGKRLDHA